MAVNGLPDQLATAHANSQRASLRNENPRGTPSQRARVRRNARAISCCCTFVAPPCQDRDRRGFCPQSLAAIAAEIRNCARLRTRKNGAESVLQSSMRVVVSRFLARRGAGHVRGDSQRFIVRAKCGVGEREREPPATISASGRRSCYSARRARM